jgi:hypothetical protein
MTAPKPVARPKSELPYKPVQTNKPARKLTREERRNGVGDKPKGMKETLIEVGEAAKNFNDAMAAEDPKPTPVKQPFVLQPHLTHRPFAGLKQNLKGTK